MGYDRDATTLPQSGLTSTELGTLIQGLTGKLPVELQRMICDRVSCSLFSSLSRCLETLTWIADYGVTRALQHAPTISVQRPLQQRSAITAIGAKIVPFPEEYCLMRINADMSTDTAYDQTIPVSDEPIAGVQYVLGLYGVRGLRVHYQDGSTSPWLGDVPVAKWSKFIQGTDLTELEIQDDVRDTLSSLHT
jgi:hypothetical protein